MRENVSPLQRLMATSLSVFLTVGLGLIGPASALAGMETGGLSYTIVSDDISKSATGSVPAPPEGSTSTSAAAYGGGSGSTTGGCLNAGNNAKSATPIKYAPPRVRKVHCANGECS